MTAAYRSPFNLSAHLRPTVGDQKISYTSVDHMGWLFSNVPTSYAIGDTAGEQIHTLTIAEMPTHNHGTQTDLSGAPPELFNLTSTNGEHSHTYQDPGHAHGYENQPFEQRTDNAFGTEGAADNTNQSQNTTIATVGITINENGAHTHTLQSQGSNQPHNNMQPTLFGGNMFIYSGKNMQAYFPYTWVGNSPASDPSVAPTPGNVLVF